MTISQTTLRASYIESLHSDILQKMENDGLTFAAASVRVLLEWLGYENSDVTFLDGRDRGVDAWFATEAGIDIFQVKTHELDKNQLLDLSPFDSDGIKDLERAMSFILYEEVADIDRKPLKDLLYRRDYLLRNRSLQEERVDLPITLHFVVLGQGLTQDALSEYKTFQESTNNVFTTEDGVQIRCYSVMHTLDQVIDAKWRESNRDWIDRDNKKLEEITLQPWNSGAITDNSNAIFYCRAIDLVNAYDKLGYQLFEPNVRANIKNSRVNQAIRESVLHQRTRREFRFLNNGVTIIADSFTAPKGNNTYFKVRHPGVVNGLQTVVALHSAYYQLSHQEKADFEKNCSVLVRLLLSNAVDDITRVVKATNNQNPMKPRNLMSNTTEQLTYARIFAKELGWFYEAKEGAWDAYEKDYKRWRPSLNKHPREFRVQNRGRVKKVDNEELAQTWLAFIGYSSEAVNDRRFLFEDKYYNLIFKQRTLMHGFDYEFSISRASAAAINQSPNHSLMLVSFLSREFAKIFIPSGIQNRKDAILRLGYNPNAPKAEIDALLIKDEQFLLNQALGGMSYLFTEFLGFVLYRALGEEIHQYGHRILQNHSFRQMSHQLADDVVENVETGQFDSRDLLAVLWLAFVDSIEDMFASPWKESYLAAPVKSRLVFSRETRDKLYKSVIDMDEFMKRRNLKKPWALGVGEKQSLFEFIRSCVLEKE